MHHHEYFNSPLIMKEKNIAYERVIFFSDAVVAIAITLLALELRVELPPGEHLTFSALIKPWHNYAAFLLSFVTIAGLWRTHHNFFVHIERIDERMLYINILWLFFLVVLPFSTTLVSQYFGDTPAIFIYSLNIFLLSLSQNFIWDYANGKEEFMTYDEMQLDVRKRISWMMNAYVINAFLAMIFSFYMPKTAFLLLYFRVPIFIFGLFYLAQKRRIELSTNGRKPSRKQD